MKTSEAADKIRRIVFEEEKRSQVSSLPYEQPVPFNGLSYRNQDHWKNIANAAGAVFAAPLEED